MAVVDSNAQAMACSLDWRDALIAASVISARNPWAKMVYGVPMGGIAAAALTNLRLTAPAMQVHDASDLRRACSPRDVLVLDDLVDSGRTLQPYVDAGFTVDALYRKPHSPAHLAPRATEADGWIQFPWEKERGPEDAVVRLLEWMGEDPAREGLRDTPKRVVKAMREMSDGLRIDPRSVLGTVFNEACDEMVVVRNLRYSSMCEHHLLPFTGTATVGYVPNGRIIGLSKIPRLVNVFAKRPQVQERMTAQIADTLMDVLAPRGVGVVLKGHHSCMGCRGVKQPDGEMITSAMRGIMKEDPRARSELLGFL